MIKLTGDDAYGRHIPGNPDDFTRETRIGEPHTINYKDLRLYFGPGKLKAVCMRAICSLKKRFTRAVPDPLFPLRLAVLQLNATRQPDHVCFLRQTKSLFLAKESPSRSVLRSPRAGKKVRAVRAATEHMRITPLRS